MKKWFSAFLIFFAAAWGGRQFSMTHFHGEVAMPRTPAAIPKVFDYSHLEGEALNSALQRRLLTGTEFTKGQDGIELHVGHFVTNNTDGKPAFACDIYNRVTFVFQAEGFAVSGERPTLTVEGPCEMSNSMSETKPLLIPVDQVLAESPGNIELNYMEGLPVSLKFANMTEEWPHQWSLSEIKLFNRNDGRSIILDSKNLRKLSSNPLTMVW